MTQTIRKWAREQGMTVGDRGLIPRDIIERYKDANGIGGGPSTVVTHTVSTASVEVAHYDTQPELVAPVTRTLADWLQLRNELAAMIRSGMSPEETAEHILLEGWAPR